MQFFRKLLLFITLCFVVAISVAQQIKTVSAVDSYRAIHWTGGDGLPIGWTHTMFKDTKGFLRIGSTGGGFCRFDGTNFKRYHYGQEKTGTINSDAIYSFKEDRLHNIWMGTSAGISRYDMKTDTFT